MKLYVAIYAAILFAALTIIRFINLKYPCPRFTDEGLAEYKKSNWHWVTVFLAGLLMSCIAITSYADCDKAYAKVGAGYKFAEKYTLDSNQGEIIIDHHSPIAARIELGVDCGKVTWGVAHYSQWFDGYPFNNRKELVVNEFFIDYKFEWNL